MRNSAEIIERMNKMKHGALTIYLGYAYGVGKTYKSIQEGLRLKKRGIDIVVGIISSSTRSETSALAQGLEIVPSAHFPSDGRDVEELDVQGVIRRKPDTVVIDDLEHRNHSKCKNERRYQDVIEILEEGINVITTLNIQGLESVADKISQSMNFWVPEKIPEWVLRIAKQIVVVDVSLEELRERLRTGKLFDKPEAETAFQNFYTYENLMYLRQIMFREIASDQIRRIEELKLLGRETSDLVEEAVMVALSSDPDQSEVLLKKGMRLANQLSSRCYAVHVKKVLGHSVQLNSVLQGNLRKNITLAKTIGAEFVTIEAENIAEALATFASRHYVKHIIFGKSRRAPMVERIMGSLVSDFIHDSVGVEVHIVTTAEKKRREVTAYA